MLLTNIRLKISTPTEPVRNGRGFYQVEEDTLFVQVGQFSDQRKFFSYIESEQLRLDCDRSGRLIFIECARSRKLWDIESQLKKPSIIEPADIRFLDFRSRIEKPQYISNNDNSLLMIKFDQCSDPLNYYLAENVVASVGRDSFLKAIWIDAITEDIAGREIRKFRSSNRPIKSYFH